MNKFDHLIVRTADTVEYEMHELPGAPVLTVRPANQLNEAYQKAIRAEMFGGKRKRGRRRSAVQIDRLSDSELDSTAAQFDDATVKLYPEHVVVNWAGMADPKGKDIPFTKENCGEFLSQLRNGTEAQKLVFDRLRDFCAEADNFMSRDGGSEASEGETRNLGNA